MHKLGDFHCNKLRTLKAGDGVGAREYGTFTFLNNEALRTKMGPCTIRSELRYRRFKWLQVMAANIDDHKPLLAIMTGNTKFAPHQLDEF